MTCVVVVQVSNRNVLEQKAQVNVWQQIGATEPSAAAQQLMKQNDNFGYKSRTQMLAQGQPQVPTYLSAPRPRPPRPPHTHTHTHTQIHRTNAQSYTIKRLEGGERCRHAVYPSLL